MRIKTRKILKYYFYTIVISNLNMKMTKFSKYKIPSKYFSLSLWLSATISLLVHFSSFLDEFMQVQNQQLPINIFLLNIFLEFFITFFIAFILFNLNYLILQPLQVAKKMGTFRIVISLVISYLIVLFLSDFLFQIKRQLHLNELSHGTQNIYFFRDIFIVLVVFVSVLIIRVIFKNQQNQLEIQQLKIENLSRQFESLKGQLSPHFLFNSLTALKTLIGDSPAIAEKYTEHLSLVLRYTLQASEKRLVTLSDEISFLESYFFLVQMRYNKNILLELNVDKIWMDFFIPPLSLQILTENAIRHNEISKKNLLKISIVASEKQISVTNTINPKITPEPGTGIGLSNLANQYRLLSGKEINISKLNNSFCVTIPLLES